MPILGMPTDGKPRLKGRNSEIFTRLMDRNLRAFPETLAASAKGISAQDRSADRIAELPAAMSFVYIHVLIFGSSWIAIDFSLR
jgi:uncharacterized membrane protein